MNLSDKERHAKRRKRNVIAKRLREDQQYRQQVIPKKKYNRQEWKNDEEILE